MIMPGDPLSLPLIEIARELRDRRATARELVDAAIARHESLGERLHAYSFWAPEHARAVADAADAAFAAGVSAGPLQGLPVSLKDLFAAAGYPCYAGSSRRLPADPWERDGPLVATLRRQLGVIMGKTHMVEFAFGGTGQNSHHGAPYNPWDAAAHRSVGGSSSGAGVSLLEGSALLAPTQREFFPHVRAKKLPTAAECLVYSLTPSGVLAENHPKNRGFVGILRGQKCLRRGQKCLKRRFFTAISRWRVVSRRALDASGFWQG